MPGRLEKEKPTRRDFIGMAGLWTSGLAIVGSLLGILRLPKPNLIPEASKRVKIGKPAEFPPGTVRLSQEHKIRIISTTTGVAAISLICTHLGCVVTEEGDGFSCPCHGSKFTSQGKVLGGPAPRSLPWHALSLSADGSLVVDLNKEVEVDTFFSA